MRDTIKKITILSFYSMIFFVISLAYAENDTAQSKPLKEYYPDGQLKKESYQTKRKKGHKVYFQNGKLKFKRKVNLKTDERISTAYYENGKVKSKLIQNPDDSGKVIGTWRYYSEDGSSEAYQDVCTQACGLAPDFALKANH